MNIEKGNFIWRNKLGPLNLDKVDSIALHHIAHSTWDEMDVHKYHYRTNKWNGIGYNYFIRFDGKIIECRGLHQGAGVGGHNSHIISIGFQGDFDKQKEMSKEQFEAGVWLINYLKSTIPTIKTVAGHKAWTKTACPGKYFPLQKMIDSKPPETLNWKLVALHELHQEGLIQDLEGWTAKIDDPLPVWSGFIIMNNIYKKLKG